MMIDSATGSSAITLDSQRHRKTPSRLEWINSRPSNPSSDGKIAVFRSNSSHLGWSSLVFVLFIQALVPTIPARGVCKVSRQSTSITKMDMDDCLTLTVYRESSIQDLLGTALSLCFARPRPTIPSGKYVEGVQQMEPEQSRVYYRTAKYPNSPANIL